MTAQLPSTSTTPIDLVSINGAEQAGAVVWWRTSGGIDLAALDAAWGAAGLPIKLVPSAPRPSAALRRAVNEHRGERRLVRPLASGGFALVDENASGDDLQHEVTCRAKLVPPVGDGAPTIAVEPPDHPIAPHLTASYAAHLGQIEQGDVSPWLVKVIEHCQAVSLRDTGGIYFVPKAQLDTWRAMVAAIRTAGQHTVFEMPALKSDEAVAALLDAVVREAEATASLMEQEVSGGDLGERALKTRVERAAALESKVTSYEGLLGTTLTEIHERCERLRAQLTIALVQASASEGEASGGTSLGDL